MAGDVYIKSGEQTRYLRFGGATGTNSTTTTGASMPIYKESPFGTFQGVVSGTGTVSATIQVQVTNEDLTAQGTNSNWITMSTITLSGTTSATDGFSTIASWRWVRANVTAISGTGATVSVMMGV